MKKWVFRSMLFVFLPILLLSQAAFSESCEDYLSFANLAESQRGNFADKHPEFLNPEVEKKKAQLWKGEIGPELLQRMLPPGVSFVGHQLRKAAAPGVVKVEQKKGDFLILRVEMPFKGKTISTNVTLNAQSLFKNLERSFKGEKMWLVGPEATAALDWGHGGGTKTTGGHTADTLMNYMAKYNVFTFGMDQPWHGEGPREWFENADEYFEFRVAFRNQFVHPDVPTFLVGHSKGGLVSDMAVRRTGPQYKALGLDKAYAGMIALSFVPDPKPESASFQERTTKERAKDMAQKEEEVMARMNPGDCSLFANLMAEDKISPLSGLMCTQLSMYNVWKKDTETSLPSLYVMGEHDGLYLLSEESIEDYVRRLPGATLWTYSARVNFRGEVEPVGHMIFDHFMPKEDHEEARAMMAQFLKEQGDMLAEFSSEEELRALFKESVLKGHVNDYSFLTPVNNYSSTLVLMAYLWVPEFKAFLENRMAQLAESKGQTLEQFKTSYFLSYAEEEDFETNHIIRDFVTQTLKEKGIELEEVSAKQHVERAQQGGEVLGPQRDVLIALLKVYGNNLAFREFLKTYNYMEIGATSDFEALNRIGGELTQRLKLLTNIQKEKISDEDKADKIDKLEILRDDQGQALNNSDIEGLKAALERIQDIRNKRWVPVGDKAEFAEANIEERAQNHEFIKELEKRRDQLKTELENLKRESQQIESALQVQIAKAQSPALAAYEARRKKLHGKLETYDLKVRDVQEAFLVELIEGKKSIAEAFDHLPEEVLAAYEEAEMASQSYQALLKEGEALRKKEAVQGALGSEIHRQAQRLWGSNGLESQMAQLNERFRQVEYVELSEARMKQDLLLAEYVAKVMPQYLVVNKVKVYERLKNLTSPNEIKEAVRYAEKAFSYWRSKILISKPEDGEASLN